MLGMQTMSRYKLGDQVKVEFADEHSGESEWMWVKVDHSDDENRLVFGTLDSEPIVNAGLKVGRELSVSYDKIREHRRFVSP